MKKFVKILSLSLVAVMLLATLASCAPASDPDKAYVERIMPAKIALNMRYINHRTVGEYFRIIFATFVGIAR